jgi:uncharacterized protein
MNRGRGAEVRMSRGGRSSVTREARGSGDGKSFRGLAAVFYRADNPDTEYWLWDDMVERIQPGAFDRAIKEAQDVRGLFDHNSSQLLGRVSSGTLRVSITSEGLAYEIDEDPRDPDHQRVAAKIDRDDLTGSSFAFIPRKTTWVEEKQDDRYLYIRNVEDVDLYDVGPVTWPAYEGTTAGRNAGQLRSELLRRGMVDLPAVPSEVAALIVEREAELGPLRRMQDQSVSVRMRQLELDHARLGGVTAASPAR